MGVSWKISSQPMVFCKFSVIIINGHLVLSTCEIVCICNQWKHPARLLFSIQTDAFLAWNTATSQNEPFTFFFLFFTLPKAWNLLFSMCYPFRVSRAKSQSEKRKLVKLVWKICARKLFKRSIDVDCHRKRLKKCYSLVFPSATLFSLRICRFFFRWSLFCKQSREPCLTYWSGQLNIRCDSLHAIQLYSAVGEISKSEF